MNVYSFFFYVLIKNMFSHKTQLDELDDPNAEAYNYRAANTTPFRAVALADSPDEFGAGGQLGLDRAWWANTMSGARHSIGGHTVCSTLDMPLTTIASMQSQTDQYNETCGTAFSFQRSDHARKRFLGGGMEVVTGMRPLPSMNTETLIPGSINQQFELDMKSHQDYALAIFKSSASTETPASTWGTMGQLGANAAAIDAAAPSKFLHTNQLAAKLAELNTLTAGGNTALLACDLVFFGIREIKLVVATVADKANKALPSAMLIEWEDHDIQKTGIATGIDSINAQLDIQHGHKISVFSRIPTLQTNNIRYKSVASARQEEARTTECAVMIGGDQYPSPAYQLANYVSKDSLRAFMTYCATNHGIDSLSEGGDASFIEWTVNPLFTQQVSIPSEAGKQKLNATLRMKYGDTTYAKQAVLVSTYIKGALLTLDSGQLSQVKLSTI